MALSKRILLIAAAALVVAAAFFFLRRRGDEPDIVLVTIDTLRADCVGFSGRSKVKTPFLDELAAQGIWFENAHAHNVVTLPSHANILTGLLPYQHGIRDNAGFSADNKPKQVEALVKRRTVAGTLRERGYVAGAFVAAYPLDSHFGLDADFDVYDDHYGNTTGASPFDVPERPAAAVLDAARQWYEANAGKKRFLWVHLYEPHAPYEPPSPFREQYPDVPYYGEVAATDDALGSFLRPILRDRPETMVIVTADHGEGQGEHGEVTHGLFAYEETLHVPLILYERGRIEPRREKAFVRHVDIVPTILARLGIAKPAELTGESLLALNAPRDTYFEALWGTLNLGWAPLVGMIHDGHKYIDLPLAELYDLRSDPLEKKNLLAENRRMTTRIRQRLAAAAPNAAQNVERNVTPEEAKNLLSLGYLTGTAAAKKTYTADDDPKNLVRYYARLTAAVEHYRKGEWDEAVRVAENLVRERPEMAMAKDLLAFVLQQTEQGGDAEKLLRDAVAAGTANDAMKKRLGLILSEKGEAAEAVRLLSAFAGTNDPALLNAYGIALADVGRAREAVQQFQRVLQIEPKNAVAFQNLGIVALRAGDVSAARQYLSRALEINPKMPRALNTLGVVYARQDDLPRAVEAWQRAVAADPRQYDALFNLGMVAGRAGRYDEARRALTQFVATAPKDRYARDIATARQALSSLR